MMALPGLEGSHEDQTELDSDIVARQILAALLVREQLQNTQNVGETEAAVDYSVNSGGIVEIPSRLELRSY